MATYGPLLFCYDGSEDAKDAIRSAGRLLGKRHALVLTVWEPAVDPGGVAWLGESTTVVNFAELDRAVAEHGERVADQGVRLATEEGLDAMPITVKAIGPVWKAILEIADREGAAVIAMGCRGLTGVRSLLLGSVVERRDPSCRRTHASRPSQQCGRHRGTRPHARDIGRPRGMSRNGHRRSCQADL